MLKILLFLYNFLSFDNNLTYYEKHSKIYGKI